MSPDGTWTLARVTPALVGRVVLVGTSPHDGSIRGVVTDIEGLVVTIEDELGDLHTLDTSDGRHIWMRAS